MTLILTELTKYGIVMVADNAITITCSAPDGTIKERSFKGLTKLFPIEKIQAGLSYWGWSTVKPFQKIQKGILFDWWINAFLIENNDEYSSLEELALLLEKELRDVIPKLTDKELKETPLGNGGIHLAGHVEVQGNKVPSFWHIHNGISQVLPDKKLDPTVVNANHDCPPEVLINELSNERYLFRNGEIDIFIPLFDSLSEYIKNEFHNYGYFTPMPLLRARADYYKAQIQLLSSIYYVSGKIVHGKERSIIYDIPVSVSNEISLLTISNGIIRDYSTT